MLRSTWKALNQEGCSFPAALKGKALKMEMMMLPAMRGCRTDDRWLGQWLVDDAHPVTPAHTMLAFCIRSDTISK
jgi:hypothetical protein